MTLLIHRLKHGHWSELKQYPFAIQDPRHSFKVTQPESQMVEVVIYVSSDSLTTCTALVQLGSCETQHCHVNRCKYKLKLSRSSILLDKGVEDEHSGEEFISNR